MHLNRLGEVLYKLVTITGAAMVGSKATVNQCFILFTVQPISYLQCPVVALERVYQVTRLSKKAARPDEPQKGSLVVVILNVFSSGI